MTVDIDDIRDEYPKFPAGEITLDFEYYTKLRYVKAELIDVDSKLTLDTIEFTHETPIGDVVDLSNYLPKLINRSDEEEWELSNYDHNFTSTICPSATEGGYDHYSFVQVNYRRCDEDIDASTIKRGLYGTLLKIKDVIKDITGYTYSGDQSDVWYGQDSTIDLDYSKNDVEVTIKFIESQTERQLKDDEQETFKLNSQFKYEPDSFIDGDDGKSYILETFTSTVGDVVEDKCDDEGNVIYAYYIEGGF